MAQTNRFSLLEPAWPGIQGWSSPENFPIWRYLLNKQSEFKVYGHALEIGAFMGKSAAMMAASINTDEHEKLVLIDTNIREMELNSAIQLAGLDDPDSVIFSETDSRGAFAATLGIEQRSVRWMHIDGEHTGSAVTNDLDLAHDLVRDGGIIVVDDFFAGAYPQVTFSAVKYLHLHPERFVPFLIAAGKLYLSRPNQAFWYKQHLAIQIMPELKKAGFSLTLCKTTTCEDLDCFSIIADTNDQQLRGPDWDLSKIQFARGFDAQQLDEISKNSN